MLLIPTLVLGLFQAGTTSNGLPPGFEWQTVSAGLSLPVALAFAPDDDLYVATKPGLVWRLAAAGGAPQAVLDLSGLINAHGDRGLLGLALDPLFVADGGAQSHAYLLATISPIPNADPSPDFDGQYSWSALLRVRLQSAMDGTVTAVPGSLTWLLGERGPSGAAPTAIASLNESHSNGALRFGSDGSLLVAAGDGARYYDLDVGALDPAAFEDSIHPVTGLQGPYSKDQDSGAFRAQSLLSLAGKVLRVDPATGAGYPSNPYFDGDPASLASRIWALGFRNPFRMALDPSAGALDPALGQPGLLVVADVGSSLYEELDAIPGPGFNGGWPCFEGPFGQPDYGAYAAPIPAASWELDCSSAASANHQDAPSLAWSRLGPGGTLPAGKHFFQDGTPGLGLSGACAIAGAFYLGSGYPEPWRGALFFGDHTGGWIAAARFDPAGQLLSVQDFVSGAPRLVDIAARPSDGDLFCLFLGVNGNPARIRRLRFGNNLSPSAALSAFPAAGELPLEVTFDAGASTDPENDPLEFRFDFGDGTLLGPSQQAEVTHTYTQPGLYQVQVTVTDGQGGFQTANTPIAAGLEGVAILLSEPKQGSLWSSGPVALAATASNPAGQSVLIQWTVDLIHESHVHPAVFTGEGEALTFEPDLHTLPGEVSYLRVRARATDDDGAFAEAVRYVFPSALVHSVSGRGALISSLDGWTPPSPQGASNQDIEVLRDLAPLPGSGSALETFASDHPQAAVEPSYFGVLLETEPAPNARYFGLDLLQGQVLPAEDPGFTTGWFESLWVETRIDGLWTPVAGLVAYPALADVGPQGPLATGPTAPAPFARYELRFEPAPGDGIRVCGPPSAQGCVSLAELCAQAVLPLAQNPLIEHAPQGQPIAKVFELDPPMPLGDGNPSIDLIRDGTWPPIGSTSAWAQFDSRHGGEQGDEDWFGYRFPCPVTVTQVEFAEGRAAVDGGYLTDLVIETQAQPGGPWLPLGGLDPVPAYPLDPGSTPGYERYQFDFSPRAVFGVRVQGAPGGSAGFASIAELAVRGPDFDPSICGFESYGSSDSGGLGLCSDCKPAPGLPVAFSIQGGGPFATGFLGLAAGPADLTLFGTQHLLIDPGSFLFFIFQCALDGSASVQHALAANPNLVGLRVWFQAGVIDASAIGGLRLSNGLKLTVCP